MPYRIADRVSHDYIPLAVSPYIPPTIFCTMMFYAASAAAILAPFYSDNGLPYLGVALLAYFGRNLEERNLVRTVYLNPQGEFCVETWFDYRKRREPSTVVPAEDAQIHENVLKVRFVKRTHTLAITHAGREKLRELGGQSTSS